MANNPFQQLSASFLIDLTTRVLEIDYVPDSLEEIANCHINHGNELLLAATSKYGARYSDVPKLSPAQLIVVSKLEHEFDHLRRVGSTSFGQLLAALFAKKIRHSFRLIDWEGGKTADLVGRDKEFEWNLESALSVRETEYALLADSPVPDSYSKACAASALNTMRDLGGGNHLQLGEKPYQDIIPAVSSKHGPRVIGAQALLEHFAIGKESSFAAFALGRDAAPVNEYKSVHLYSLAGSIWRDMYELPMPEVKATSWTESPECLSGRRFPVEIQAAIDLALWVPFGPSGWTPGMKWHDVHPGWRFLTILDLLKNSEVEMTPFSSANVMSDGQFATLQTDWANKLGWPSPAELGDKWLEALEQAQADEENAVRRERSWTIRDDWWRWRGDADYLRTKQKHPGFSVTTRPATHGFAHLWFHLLLAEDRNRERLDFHIPPAFQERLKNQGYRYPPAFSLQTVTEAMLCHAKNPNGRLSRRLQRLHERMGPMFSDCRNYHSRT